MDITYAPQPLTADQLHRLSQDVKQALTALYGDRLDRVILYGSYARGDFHAESDVDFLVVLTDAVVESGREVRRMSPVIGPLALNYAVEVSVFPTATARYESGHALFYQAIQQEGIAL